MNVIWYEMKQGNVQLHRIKVLVHPDKWYSYSFSSYICQLFLVDFYYFQLYVLHKINLVESFTPPPPNKNKNKKKQQ